MNNPMDAGNFRLGRPMASAALLAAAELACTLAPWPMVQNGADTSAVPLSTWVLVELAWLGAKFARARLRGVVVVIRVPEGPDDTAVGPGKK